MCFERVLVYVGALYVQTQASVCVSGGRAAREVRRFIQPTSVA